jgi:chaperonin cofactor prefoldin
MFLDSILEGNDAFNHDHENENEIQKRAAHQKEEDAYLRLQDDIEQELKEPTDDEGEFNSENDDCNIYKTYSSKTLFVFSF